MKILKLNWVLPAMVAVAGVASASLLAPWVGPNVLLGEDPALLPTGDGKNQAEPHVTRSVMDPDLVLATFQDGRFSDGGAFTNGYAVSEDGGFTWRRDLNPRLTRLNSGPYFRATDPVAGISMDGVLYLNSLVSLTEGFELGRVVIQRSTDRGHTWTDPITIFTGELIAPNARTFPDKNWMVVNDYPGTPTTGRIVVTWTNFRLYQDEVDDIDDYLIMSSYSDDNGDSWTWPEFVTPPTSPFYSRLQYQGSQPVFLPDGSLAIVFHNFLKNRIEVTLSPDGGVTYPHEAVPVHDGYILYDAPNMRDGSFLPSVGVARSTGDIYIAYTSRESEQGELGDIYFVRSQGGTAPESPTNWQFRAPIKISGTTPVRIVSTPTLSVSPDGQRVSVYFYDNRNGSGLNDSGDFYAVQSIDGGVSWTNPFRLTEQTFALNKSTSTDRGYMIGDYFGFAPPLGPRQAGVAVWVDTRRTTADPWSARIGGLEVSVFDAWLQANLPFSSRGTDLQVARYADPDKDETPNLLEYVLGTSPRLPESPPVFANGMNHLRLTSAIDPMTQTSFKGGTGRWPFQQQVLSVSPSTVSHGEGFWEQVTWPTASQFENLEVSINEEDWFLLSPTAPVQWVREEADGWVWSPWFGHIYTIEAPWLFHLTLGWVYDLEGFLYSPFLSTYIHHTVDMHPWVYRYDGHYIYLLDGIPWIYDFKAGSWLKTY